MDNAVVEEYVKSLNTDELDELNTYFQSGDRVAASEYISKARKMDSWLSLASSHDDFFNRLDIVAKIVTEKLRGKKSCLTP